MQWESTHPADYLHAIETKVPIELEALSYHSCPFVRSRVAARTTRVHVLEHLGRDPEPMVIMNVLCNKACPPRLVELIGLWMIYGDGYYTIAWYAAIENPHTLDWVRKHFIKKEADRRAEIRRKLGLPPSTTGNLKFSPMRKNNVSLLTERRLILETLGACAKNRWKKKRCRMPWGITTLGWEDYSTHWSKEVRDATHRHPYYLLYVLRKKISLFFRAAF